MTLAKLATAACLCVLLVSCGTGSSTQDTDNGRARTSVSVSPSSANEATFGSTRGFGDGLTITVSRPTQFQPSDAAHPRARRAVSFDVTIENTRGASYQLSELSITLTADGRQTERLVDETQGYTGSGRADRTMAAGETARLSVAFSVPTEPVELDLTVSPRASGGEPIRFSGQP